jgi:biopolymer transport protein ExbD
MAIRSRHRTTSEFGLSAMTDIIFMLLIFFILTSTISTEPILKVVLPKGVEDSRLATKPINLYLNAAGEYAIQGPSGVQKKITIEGLPFALQEELKQNPIAPVSIHADKTVIYEKVMEMVSVSNRAGVKVVLALDREIIK